jgi:hypothetical protein
VPAPEHHPTGWDDAGPWQRTMYALMWNGAIESDDIILFGAFSKRIGDAWEASAQALVNRLRSLKVLDPSLADLPTK